MQRNRRLIPLLAALVLVAAPATAQAAETFQVGTGSHPDVAVDAAGTAHVVWDEHSGVVDVPDPLHYCRVPRGATVCKSEITFAPPLEAIGRTSYVFAPSANRVLVETYRCCGKDEGNYLFESTDGGLTFGPARRIGNLDHQSDAIFGPGDAISGASIARFQRMPLSGPAATETAEFTTSFAIPTHSGIGLFGGAPLQVIGDSDDTVFVRNNGSDPNQEANWGPESAITPPGGEPRVAGGPAGLVLLYSPGEPGNRALAARKFDGTSFGPPVNVSESGEPIFFDLWAEPSTGEFHAVWIANGESPNELRWARSKDGVTWSKPQTIVAGEEADNMFNLQVSAAPDEQGFAVFDQNRRDGEIRMAPLFPGASFDGTPDTPAASTTVGGQQITLLTPGGCLNPGTPFKVRVTSKTKKKLSPKKRVKILKVVFSLDKKKVTDKKAAFKATFSTTGFAAPSTHKAQAKVQLKPVIGKGKKKTKTLKGTLTICG